MTDISRMLRITVLKMTSMSGASHIGSMFSIAEIIEVLFFKILNIFPNNPNHPDRDFFYLSKGHAGGIVIAALAKRGFFPESDLSTYYTNGSKLSGHLSHKLPGVELSTGSLGHALSVAVGSSFGLKIRSQSNRVFCLLSDGELNEGSNWEAFMFAAHHSLNNLCIIIDCNSLQSLTSTNKTINLEPLSSKLSNFNLDVVEVDGHDVSQLTSALEHDSTLTKPRIILAHTIKGKGVSFMENSVLWHYRCAKGKEYSMAFEELRG